MTICVQSTTSAGMPRLKMLNLKKEHPMTIEQLRDLRERLLSLRRYL